LKAGTTTIDMALEGQTHLPQPGGIVKRQWVPPAVKTVSNAARGDSRSESGDSVTVRRPASSLASDDAGAKDGSEAGGPTCALRMPKLDKTRGFVKYKRLGKAYRPARKRVKTKWNGV
jgi:hypothetical protein